VWKAERLPPRLYQHAWRLAHRQRGGDSGVDDALAVLALSSKIYYDARWDGIRQALRAGATVGQVAMAMGISMDDARDLAYQDRRTRPVSQAVLQGGGPGSAGLTGDT
jgi:hypothetical protein